MKSDTKDILRRYAFAALLWAPLLATMFPAAVVWLAKLGIGWMLLLASMGAVVMLFAAVALCAWFFLKTSMWLFGCPEPEDVYEDYE